MKKPVLLSILFFSIAMAQNLIPALADTKRSSARSLEVEIISPREGEIVRGKISIQARVNDPLKVDHLDFYFQEPGAKDRYGWKDYSSPYFWGDDEHMLDTDLFADGPASASVGCYPKDSKLPISEDRVHFIIDNGKPSVRILSPKDQAIVAGGVAIKVDAEDLKGLEKSPGITAVYIYMDGSLLQKLTKKPFLVRLDTSLLATGSHSIRAVAEDSEGLIDSDVVIINLSPEASSLFVEQ